eukprot:CAMPEP_0196131734 /NCGR_PEP_ID=MMETSP0910-20130528/1614_1 /TAXON_ID=49265 /ORGANISM="Thalassiosira rotula, Strain GSO102" /LENGTH=550 /DNA_ID=CAMNT_0041391239 /DNA_START=18 /DNA_END=1667 /DNA_ORIENTATION=-
MMAAITSKLPRWSGSLVFLLMISFRQEYECLGFSPTIIGSRYLKTQHQHQHESFRTSSSSSSSWVLFGLANVNDYFASFNENANVDEGDVNSSEGNNGDVGDDGGEESKKVKYIGHGRIGGDGNEATGGLFDINNYFNAFNEDNDNKEDKEDEPSPSMEMIDEPSSSSSSSSSPLYQNNEQQQSTARMTYGEIMAYNDARLCPKHLLTQRAIQSFMYLLEECRDPHSGKWIEDFLGLQNLGNYHGTAAINITKYPTWDTVLHDMMQQPNDKIIVSAKRRGRGHGGWSKNNPYLEERWVEFKIDIHPASIVHRLLPVREQLAKEFERDLDVVGIVDEMIMDSYFDKLRDDESGGQQEQQQHQQQPSAFDRISYATMTNITEFQDGGGSSSPFRRGNFDLLYSLCTQASAHRLLRELQQSKSSSSSLENDVTYQWFKRFYIEQASIHFDGDQGFGRADDFIDALLRTPPSLVELSDGSKTVVGLTDPLRIAERIIALRSEIATEWKGMMRGVTEEHMELNDVLFRVMMGRTIDESGNEVVEIEEESEWVEEL